MRWLRYDLLVTRIWTSLIVWLVQVHPSCQILRIFVLPAWGIRESSHYHIFCVPMHFLVLISRKESQNKARLTSLFWPSILTSTTLASVSFCRNCERFLSPPTSWTLAKPESSELLAICLRKLKGLSKVRLTEAHFIWTEPHSKRLRVSMTIQKEVHRPLLLPWKYF